MLHKHREQRNGRNTVSLILLKVGAHDNRDGVLTKQIQIRNTWLTVNKNTLRLYKNNQNNID